MFAIIPTIEKLDWSAKAARLVARPRRAIATVSLKPQLRIDHTP